MRTHWHYNNRDNNRLIRRMFARRLFVCVRPKEAKAKQTEWLLSFMHQVVSWVPAGGVSDTETNASSSYYILLLRPLLLLLLLPSIKTLS